MSAAIELKDVSKHFGTKRAVDGVTFEVAEDGRVVLGKVGRRGPVARPQSRFAKLRGRASAGMTTEDIMALTRRDE